MGSAGMKYGPVHNELNGSDTHGSLASSGQLFVKSSERDSSGYKTRWIYGLPAINQHSEDPHITRHSGKGHV
mgnify:CR=1 FL=1